MDFSLIETLRWQSDLGYVRLNLHMARLVASAKTLGFEGAGEAEIALQEFAKKELGSILISPIEGRSATHGAVYRVRLELYPDGKISITSAPFALQPEHTVWNVKIASTLLSSDDRLLRHKTSRRSVYDQARVEVTKDDADEVLLLNERGELCEGTITSLFVEGDNGVFLTPPLSSGLLAGVLRTSLLCAKKARVQKLMPEDLKNKTVYIGNSLRGLIKANII